MLKVNDRVEIIKLSGDKGDFVSMGTNYADELIGTKGVIESIDPNLRANKYPINVKLEFNGKIFGFAEEELNKID